MVCFARKKEAMSDTYAFVDLQGFKSNTNKFIVKEIAVVTENIAYHDIIKSAPSTFSKLDAVHKKQAMWLTYNFHGLKLNWGFITFYDMRKDIKAILNGKTVFIKGVEKIDWMEAILGRKWRTCRIIDVETLNCALSLFTNDDNEDGRNTYEKKFTICNNHKAMRATKKIQECVTVHSKMYAPYKIGLSKIKKL